MSDLKQTDWVGKKITHGGKRDGAGRKPSGRKTTTIRVDVELLPAIEQLKRGELLNDTTSKQAEIDRLLEVNMQRVLERDAARIERDQLKSQLTRLEWLRDENKTLTTQLAKDRQRTCQCLTAKGDKCEKKATHENKRQGFVVWTCEQHYKSTINKSSS
jgi:hypothetical protein